MAGIDQERRGGGPADGRLALLIAALLLLRLVLYTWAAGGMAALPAALCHWDCDWYKGIAGAGYPTHPKTIPDPTFAQASWAFFPLFPALERGAGWLTGGSDLVAGIVVSNVALGLYAYFAAKYLRCRNPGIGGAAVVAFLLAYPFGFYLSLPYTEAVYAALTMAAFWALARGETMQASLLGACLSATRVTGVMLTPIIAARTLAPALQAWRRDDTGGAAAAVSAALLPVAVAPLGLFLFMLYLYVHTGDGFAFLHIQRAWGRGGENPLRALMSGLWADDLTRFAPRREESMTFASLSALAGLALAGWLLRRRRYGESWFLAMAILLPLSHGLSSLPRYALAQPLFMLGVFELAWAACRRWMFWGIVAVSAAAQLGLVGLWMRGYAFLH